MPGGKAPHIRPKTILVGLEVMEQLDFDSRKDIEQFIYGEQ